jgi:multiple sugar transport system permease protein
MSVNEWPLLGSPELNFPDNYAEIPDNQLFVDSVWFTLKYTAIVTVVLSAVAFGLALLVQEQRPGVGFLRTAYFLPGAVGFAAAALLFYGFYSEIGPLDSILQGLGIVDEPVNWIGTPNMALFSTIAMVIWRFAGFNMLILLTGLQSIPTEVYEAARSDGASRWQTLRYVTLPLLRPTITLALLFRSLEAVRAFDLLYAMTEGGPAQATELLSLYTYRTYFGFLDFGYGATLAVMMVLVSGLIAAVYVRLIGTAQSQ